MPFVAPVAVAPLDGRITTGTADGGHTGGTGRAGPRHMDLIDGVERVGGMPGQHVGEARREAAAWREEDAGATCRLVELEHCVDARGVVDGLGGGTPPLPRSFTNPPTRTAITATIRPRRSAFMVGSVGLVARRASGRVGHERLEPARRGQPVKMRGARWNRTTDLILIRDAL